MNNNNNAKKPVKPAVSKRYPPKKRIDKNPLSVLQRKERKRVKRQRRAILFASFLFCYFVFALIIAGYFKVSYSIYGESPKKYSVSLIENEKTVEVIDTDALYRDGKMYIPLSKLSKICKFVITGDNSKICALLDDNNSAEFFKDSAVAIINGEQKRFSAPVIFTQNEHYIPFDFVRYCIIGLDCVQDIKKDTYNIQCSPLQAALRYSFCAPVTTDKAEL